MSSSSDRDAPPENGGMENASGLSGSHSGSSPGPSPGADPDAGLSASWKRRFALIDRAGGWDGQKLATPKALTTWELARVQFNIWGLLFGFFYYVFKGMWKKGLVLLPISLAIGNLAYYLGLPISSSGMIAGVPCAVFANGDFYRYRRFGETMWPVFRGLDRGAFLLPSSLGAAFLIMTLFTVLWTEKEYSCSSEVVTEGLRDLLHDTSGAPRSGLRLENIRALGEGPVPDSLACAAGVRGLIPEETVVTVYILQKGEGFGDIRIYLPGR